MQTISRLYFLETKKENLYPLTVLKNIYELKVGALTLGEKILRLYKPDEFYVCEKDVFIEHGLCGIFNSKIIFTKSLFETIKIQPKKAYYSGENFVCAFVEHKLEFDAEVFFDKNLCTKNGFEVCDVFADCIKYPWDIIKLNGKAIKDDFEFFKESLELDKNIDLIGSKDKIFIGKNVRFYGRVTISVKDGPVIISDNSIIKAPTIIEGPAFIGTGSLIDGAKIRQETTIGEGCKIAGEIEASVFSDFSNKHHDGFIGHAYIGSWVNMGALTTNSDLKNNYHSVKVNLGKDFIDTKELKVGCFVGDFVTFGIGTLIPTGAVVSPVCNIFGGGVIKRYYPSFSWHDNGCDKMEVYDKALAKETFSIMLSRRKKQWDERVEKFFN